MHALLSKKWCPLLDAVALSRRATGRIRHQGERPDHEVLSAGHELDIELAIRFDIEFDALTRLR